MTSAVQSGGGAPGDTLLPFLFERAPVRGALVRLDSQCRAILARQAYPQSVARALSELLAACALLASSLKLEGSLIAQISGDGPLRLLVVECTGTLELRAMAQWDAQRVVMLPDDAPLSALAGGALPGRLALTLDRRDAGTLCQGIVELDSASIAASIEHYLTTSEQLPSRLVLVANDGQVDGLLLQRLPSPEDAHDPTWSRVAARAAAAAPATLRLPEFTQTLGGLFPHDDLRIFPSRPVVFRCRCSVARVSGALVIAGRDEIEAALREGGSVDVTCEFCNRRYSFGPVEARALFPATRPAAPQSDTLRK